MPFFFQRQLKGGNSPDVKQLVTYLQRQYFFVDAVEETHGLGPGG